MGIEYADEKFSTAIRSMALGGGTLQERLVDAYLSFHTLRKEDFPEEKLWNSFQDIHERLTCIDATGDEGTVAATTRQMSFEEAHEVGSKIADLADTISRLYHNEN